MKIHSNCLSNSVVCLEIKPLHTNPTQLLFCCPLLLFDCSLITTTFCHLGLLYLSLCCQLLIMPDYSLITSVWIQLIVEWLRVINEEGAESDCMQETMLHCAMVHSGKSQGLGCSNYHVPSGRDVKRLSIDLHAPGDSPKPNEVQRRGE